MNEDQNLVGEVTESVRLEPGTYQAKIVGIERKTMKFGDVLEFQCKLLDADESVTFDTIKGQAGFKEGKIQVGSKLYKWLSNIARKEPDLKTKVDISKFIGMQCQVKVENKPGTKPGTMFSNVTDMFPIRQAKSSQASTHEEENASTEVKREEKKDEKKDFEF